MPSSRSAVPCSGEPELPPDERGQGDRERWNARYREASHTEAAAPRWLDEDATPHLPASGAALDVACGAGRISLWLATRGFEVLAVDVSDEGLARCSARAEAEGLRVTAHRQDLEKEPLPPGPFSVITCFHYLQRDLFPEFVARLEPGGVLVCEIKTRRNLERHDRPSARFLLAEGELAALCGDLEIVHHEEGWFEDLALARVVARRAR